MKVYDKEGMHKDSVGKRFNLKPKTELNTDLEILGNFDDDDDGEDGKEGGDDSNVKKGIKIL